MNNTTEDKELLNAHNLTTESIISKNDSGIYESVGLSGNNDASINAVMESVKYDADVIEHHIRSVKMRASFLIGINIFLILIMAVFYDDDMNLLNNKTLFLISATLIMISIIVGFISMYHTKAFYFTIPRSLRTIIDNEPNPLRVKIYIINHYDILNSKNNHTCKISIKLLWLAWTLLFSNFTINYIYAIILQ